MLAAGFLVVAAVVLAYLGGVMSGRAYWKAHPQPIAARSGMSGASAPSSATAPDDDPHALGGDQAPGADEGTSEPKQKVLAAEELRFARVLRNDAATGDAPLKPLPPARQH